MQKILVTGATGFIGGYVIKELLQQGFNVIATSSNQKKAEQKNWINNVTYLPLDFSLLDDNINYHEYFQQPDTVIHLAWEGLPNYNDNFHINENLPRHKLFLHNLVKNGLQNLCVTGTCLEYGMQEGELSEEMDCKPTIAYAIAKNELRKYLESLQEKFVINLKWIRLFYMFGEGQSPKSLFSQIDKAIEGKDDFFNMSFGEQLRDFLPIEKVAETIINIATQKNINGVINCGSGVPVSVKQMVTTYLNHLNKNIKLNLGYYPYNDYEPLAFWADTIKLKQIMNTGNATLQFEKEREERIAGYEKNENLLKAAEHFNTESNKSQYSYNFSWMGRPIIQYPQDMIAMQEIIWNLKPDLIIETGIAHGGSLIYYASILELIGKGEILGIDIDIREHNKIEIENHQMAKRITMIQGSAIDPLIVEKIKTFAEGKKKVLVCLDSNHTHEHVLAELEMYSPFVTENSYIIVFDTIVENLPEGYFTQERPWGIGNNPKTAVSSFLQKNENFVIDTNIDNKLLISVAPQGYLKRIK